MIKIPTKNLALTVIGFFMFATLLTGGSLALQPASALKSHGPDCKENNKNVLCIHTKQSNSNQQNNVPFELPFP
jgi:hypothetical protein